MAKKKFVELLEIMESFLGEKGFKKGRKRGKYYRYVFGKIIKIEFVLSRIMRGGKLGEIRVFIALEYPEVEKLVCILKNEECKKEEDIFCQDIGIFCGEMAYHAFNFCSDSNMQYIAIAIKDMLLESVFPLINDYESDEKILDKFEDAGISWRQNYFSGEPANTDFYLRWISLCILNGYIYEAAAILGHIPSYYNLDKEITKERLEVICLDKKQTKSFCLLVGNKITINPNQHEIRSGLFELDGLYTYFLILQEPVKGNDLQISGGSGEFIVEIRIYDEQGYQHYRGETRNNNREIKNILYGGGYLNLQACQVLSIDQVYEIACKYLENEELHKDYEWKILDI